MTPVRRYAIGIDFGTESGRAVLVDCRDGSEVAAAVHEYAHGVIDRHLPAPDEDVALESDWALQDPRDYLEVLGTTVPAVLAQADVGSDEIVGVGVCFTSCTMLPTRADGTPLCMLDALRREPHAWVKLWKHHAAQPEADLVNEVAARRGEPWLDRYGGRISSEWFVPKALQILLEAPAVYARAERMIEASDWIVWQLTGVETRSACTAGYKAIWSAEDGFPPDAYFAALDPRFEHFVGEKLSRRIAPLGERAGGVSDRAAALTGLRAGTPVAVANVDAHVSVPAATAVEAGALVMVMGTSICHILLGGEPATVAGMCGVVEGGAIPGLYAFEAGQSAVGDILAWFVEHCLPAEISAAAAARGLGVHEVLAEAASALAPGESGLLALDWWNGNRSILVDANLSGLLVGQTLATVPAEIYRALIEATAFGTRTIIDAFESGGVPVTRVLACGGLPERNQLLMQIYADVTGREIEIAESSQTPALGAAMFGALAAGSAEGGYDSILDAARKMARTRSGSYRPDPGHHAVYDELYGEYRRLHDLFGRSGDDVMLRLRQIKGRAASARV